MKDNLESYKEADRQARGAVQRIEALRKIGTRAMEWLNYQGLILKQEYLKLRIERDLEEGKRRVKTKKLAEAEERAAFLRREIETLDKQRFEWEQELRETDASLAANDAHLLYMRLEEQISRIKRELGEKQQQADRYSLLRSQCETLLGRPLGEDPEKDMQAVEEAEQESRAEKEEARRQKDEAAKMFREALAELADLEKGILRYPDAPTALRDALEQAGIRAYFLSDVAEVTEPPWADAVEGWLNTRRFALLVEPAKFQPALEVYERLPRSVAGAFLPNLEKMRGAETRKGSLAELVKTDSPYGRIYLDYALGEVLCADIASLRKYGRAVTRECMTYSNHTASRIHEDVYRRHYLGQAARKERREFLLAEQERLRRERDEGERREQAAAAREDLFHRAARTLTELGYLLPAVEACRRLGADLARTEAELAAVDTASFRELQEKREALAARIRNAEAELNRLHTGLGGVTQTAAGCREELVSIEASLREREDNIRGFGEQHPLDITECEGYAEKQLAKSSVQELASTYESTLKSFRSRAENIRTDYQKLVQTYDRDFNALLSLEPGEHEVIPHRHPHGDCHRLPRPPGW
jgi:chromosome segregation ATPase